MRLTKGALFAVLVTLSAAAVASTRTGAAGGGQATNRPLSVKLSSTTDRVVIADGCGEPPVAACTATGSTVGLSAEAGDPDGNVVTRYAYSTTGGRIVGDGREVTLDLTGIAPGTYTVTVEVRDGRGGTASDTARIDVMRCSCPLPVATPPPCPRITVSCPSELSKPGAPLTFRASVKGSDPKVTPTFNWTVSAGAIGGGQGTSEINIDTTGLPYGLSVTASLDVGGYDRSCQTSASCTVMPVCTVMARKVDEYGVISVGDEKLRLDSFVVNLRNDPSAEGYLICYGGRRGRAGEARRRCERALSYVVSTRGVEASRVVAVDGGLREQPATESWLVPAGAEPPKPAPTVEPGAASPPSQPPASRRRRGRR